MLYKKLLRPFLLRIDPEKIHDQTLTALSWAQGNAAGRAVLHLLAGPLPVAPVNLWGLTFPNVLGMAAGFERMCAWPPGWGCSVLATWRWAR
jgi:dihydroorotate dehydrogenase